MNFRRPAPLLVAGLALAALAGCHSSEPEAPPVEANAAEEAPVEPLPEPAPAPVEAPAPAPLPEPSAAADEPAPQPDEQTQMYDDADAVGMTARAKRGDPQPATGDSTAEAPESVDPR